MPDEIVPVAASLPLAPDVVEYRAFRSILAAMRLLLECNHDINHQSPWPNASVQVHGIHLEDWYRALEVLRWYTRKTSGVRGERRGEGTSKVQNNRAEMPIYYDPEENLERGPDEEGMLSTDNIEPSQVTFSLFQIDFPICQLKSGQQFSISFYSRSMVCGSMPLLLIILQKHTLSGQ